MPLAAPPERTPAAHGLPLFAAKELVRTALHCQAPHEPRAYLDSLPARLPMYIPMSASHASPRNGTHAAGKGRCMHAGALPTAHSHNAHTHTHTHTALAGLVASSAAPKAVQTAAAAHTHILFFERVWGLPTPMPMIHLMHIAQSHSSDVHHNTAQQQQELRHTPFSSSNVLGTGRPSTLASVPHKTVKRRPNAILSSACQHKKTIECQHTTYNSHTRSQNAPPPSSPQRRGELLFLIFQLHEHFELPTQEHVGFSELPQKR